LIDEKAIDEKATVNFLRNCFPCPLIAIACCGTGGYNHQEIFASVGAPACPGGRFNLCGPRG
jgi:hypothetical protein